MTIALAPVLLALAQHEALRDGRLPVGREDERVLARVDAQRLAVERVGERLPVDGHVHGEEVAPVAVARLEDDGGLRALEVVEAAPRSRRAPAPGTTRCRTSGAPRCAAESLPSRRSACACVFGVDALGDVGGRARTGESGDAPRSTSASGRRGFIGGTPS